jgi:hypothetical protein
MPAGSARDLEAGEVVQPPGPGFVLTDAERGRIVQGLAAGKAKNISLDLATGVVRGTSREVAGDGLVAGLMRRHADWARGLIDAAAPSYGPHLRPGRASLRTRDAGDAALSPRKDDRRLHADAFPSRPTGGARILRVFSNINPDGQARVWRIGEPFEAYARRWLGRVRLPLPGEAWLLDRLGVTRGRRTAYDALMLGLHDHAKLDETYQREGPRREVAFAAGSSWIVYTDGVIHAAISGRFMLEQTFHLPVEAMLDPAASPLRVLERMTGQRLA